MLSVNECVIDYNDVFETNSLTDHKNLTVVHIYNVTMHNRDIIDLLCQYVIKYEFRWPDNSVKMYMLEPVDISEFVSLVTRSRYLVKNRINTFAANILLG